MKKFIFPAVFLFIFSINLFSNATVFQQKEVFNIPAFTCEAEGINYSVAEFPVKYFVFYAVKNGKYYIKGNFLNAYVEKEDLAKKGMQDMYVPKENLHISKIVSDGNFVYAYLDEKTCFVSDAKGNTEYACKCIKKGKKEKYKGENYEIYEIICPNQNDSRFDTKIKYFKKNNLVMRAEISYVDSNELIAEYSFKNYNLNPNFDNSIFTPKENVECLDLNKLAKALDMEKISQNILKEYDSEGNTKDINTIIQEHIQKSMQTQIEDTAKETVKEAAKDAAGNLIKGFIFGK